MFSYTITPDIELRLLQHYNAEEIYALVDRNREHLRHWFIWVDTTVNVVDIQKFIRGCLEKLAQGSELHSGIWYHGKLAGIASLFNISQPPVGAEIGYWLSADCQRKGLMTLACRALIDQAFGPLGLHRIQIRCEPDNLRSAGIPKRLGFQHEGTLRQIGLVRDELVDLDVYAILRDEWEAAR